VTGPGLAGYAVRPVVRCPVGHSMGQVYRDTATGRLFAPGLPLGGDQSREVPCLQCGQSYQVDPRRLRRAIAERWRYLVVHG
jgi:hypothetical protein